MEDEAKVTVLSLEISFSPDYQLMDLSLIEFFLVFLDRLLLITNYDQVQLYIYFRSSEGDIESKYFTLS